ncbi:hypothetical protein ACFLFF_31680 [Brevibacillus reuszeri]|uniref:BC1872 family protein n=1 Tax=Brevibacillus reuszeri TaxID=54915 RepID=UPI00366F147D
MTEKQIVLTLATKVMGWKRYEETDFWYGDNGNLFNSSLWNPLQNIADAYQVIERMNEDGYAIELLHEKAFKVCRVIKEGSVLQDIYRYSIQEAICTAAVNLTLR